MTFDRNMQREKHANSILKSLE